MVFPAVSGGQAAGGRVRVPGAAGQEGAVAPPVRREPRRGVAPRHRGGRTGPTGAAAGDPGLGFRLIRTAEKKRKKRKSGNGRMAKMRKKQKGEKSESDQAGPPRRIFLQFIISQAQWTLRKTNAPHPDRFCGILEFLSLRFVPPTFVALMG